MELLFSIVFLAALILPFPGAIFVFFRWKVWRPALLGSSLIAVALLGTLAIWKLRDVGFEALGGKCQQPDTRFFMELMSWILLGLGACLTGGSGMISARLTKWNEAAGLAVGLLLLIASLIMSVVIQFAAGMTAVDGYSC